MATNDLDSAIEQSHAAGDAILKGDPSGYKTLYSDREDVTLGNPFGPYARGRKKVEETLVGAPRFRSVLETANSLTYKVQRLLIGADRLAPEYSEGDISPRDRGRERREEEGRLKPPVPLASNQGLAIM